MTKYAFRLPPGPDTVAHAKLAEELGYESVWCPKIPTFDHDIWINLARIAENTSRIGIGASILIPSYRHPMEQASAITTLAQIAPERIRAKFKAASLAVPAWASRFLRSPTCAAIWSGSGAY